VENAEGADVLLAIAFLVLVRIAILPNGFTAGGLETAPAPAPAPVPVLDVLLVLKLLPNID
jgi:hypothetical protein